MFLIIQCNVIKNNVYRCKITVHLSLLLWNLGGADSGRPVKISHVFLQGGVLFLLPSDITEIQSSLRAFCKRQNIFSTIIYSNQELKPNKDSVEFIFDLRLL